MINEITVDIDFKKYSEMVAVVQFGSSISGDTYQGSDIDVLIIMEKDKEDVEKEIRDKLGYNYQLHFYSKNNFLESLEKREPLLLSAVHTGKTLYDTGFIEPCKQYLPNEYTVKRCMLNSFAALGMGISDLFHGMLYYDAVNSFYHAARSSLWATLMEIEITPPNRRVLELLRDEEIKEKYQRIITFRNDIPDYGHNFDLDKKIWDTGEINGFTGVLRDVHEIIRENYLKISGQNFVDCFQILAMLRKKYERPTII